MSKSYDAQRQTDQPLHAVFYVRVSTDEQAEHGTSLESQKERLTKLSELNEWQVVATYSDEGVSGRTTDRPGLLKVQEAIHSGICDVVAVTAIDRLSRTLRDLLNILDEMEDSEVVFHSIREGLDTSTLMGKFGVHMMGAVAELEHGLIAERTKDGRAKRRRQGRLSSGKPTYGYRADDNGHPEIVPDQADVVRLMYDLRANGDGIRAIRREFLARAILSPFGKPRWSESQIHRILSEPAYIGKHDSPVKYPAIIEDAIWRRARAVAKRNRSRRPRKERAEPWPFAGATCAVSGGRFKVDSGGGRSRRYHCRDRDHDSQYYSDHGGPCPVLRQPADELERLALRALIDTLDDPVSLIAVLDAAIREARERERELDKGVAPIETALDDVVEEERRNARLYRDQRLDDDELDEMNRKTAERRRALEARRDAYGPDVLGELERTRERIKDAEAFRKIAENKDRYGLLMGPSSPFNFGIAFAESCAVTKYRESGGPLSDLTGDRSTSEALSVVLARLHAEVFFHADHLEIRGLLPFNVPLPEIPASGSSSRQVFRPSEGAG